jgi:hypothetical protein
MVDRKRQADTCAKKLHAIIPMPDDWYGHRDELVIPEGLTPEMLDRAEPLIRRFMDCEEAYGEPLAILLFEIFTNQSAGTSPQQDRS